MQSELRHVLHHAAASPSTPLDLDDVLRRGRRRRRSRRLGAVAASVAALGIAAALVPRITSTDVGVRDRSPLPTASGSVLEAFPPGWSELPAPPGPTPRARAAAAWTGARLLVWGGDAPVGGGLEEPRGDGFVFDPRTRTWRPMAPSPLAARTRAVSAWTGEELLVWGGATTAGFAPGVLFGDGAAYDPDADSWRPLPPAPISARAPRSVWTGEELIVWGSADRTVGRRLTDGAAYNPATDTWRQIATAPIEFTDATAVWTGEEMILFGAVLDANNFPETPTAIGAAYRPSTDTWRRLPDSTLSPQSSTATWNGAELIAWDDLRHSAAYDPAANTWRPLPDLPLDSTGECHPPQSVSVAGYVVGHFCDATVVYDADDDAWHDVTRLQFAGGGLPLVAADPVVLFLGQDISTGAATMLAYRPPTW